MPDDLEELITLVADELPGFVPRTATVSWSDDDHGPASFVVAIYAVTSRGVDEFVQALYSRDQGSWRLENLDPAPGSQRLPDGTEVESHRVVVGNKVQHVRLVQDGKQLELPVFDGSLWLVDWQKSIRPEFVWPMVESFDIEGQWEPAMLPTIYLTRDGLVRNLLAGYESDEPLGDDPIQRLATTSAIYFDTLISEDPHQALPLLLQLVHAADPSCYGRIAAGVLEDFVVEQGSKMLPQLLRVLESDQELRECFKGVWLTRAPKKVRKALEQYGG